MHKDLRTIFRSLFYSISDIRSLPDTPAAQTIRSFVSALVGETDAGDSTSNPNRAFLLDGAHRIEAELEALMQRDSAFAGSVQDAAALLGQSVADATTSEPFRTAEPLGKTEPHDRPDTVQWDENTRRALWRVFFPEGAAIDRDPPQEIENLRRRRRITIERLNPQPIDRPADQLLFTSNVLITLPHSEHDIESPEIGDRFREPLRAVFREPQLYYYDHPIHIGVDLGANEAVYGLRGLDEAVAFEKDQGTVPADAQVSVVLSLSVTHAGLHEIAPAYLREQFARAGRFEHLNVYLFTEPDCERIVREVLAAYLPKNGVEPVLEVFGVDGEYGRHYTFLKAIAAFWQVFVDRNILGTFKIDLDQVFPQPELVDETGQTALSHFTTPLWGATGRDADGEQVELGMIAGALVNEKDIHKGLFTPDVPMPESIPAGEAAVFYNKLPMAASTQAEMMTRYDGDEPDGQTTCQQRYHVTGGTNGILLKHLRRYRPFTPTFVGRAEDQAFLLSVLYAGGVDDGRVDFGGPSEGQGPDGSAAADRAVPGKSVSAVADRAGPGKSGLAKHNGHGPYLRYLHKPGLIMRHDKEAFAGEAIAAAKTGRFVGDLARTFVFGRYAQSLPWGFDRTKAQIDPFTGCFATRRTYTVIFLRLVLYCLELYQEVAGKEGIKRTSTPSPSGALSQPAATWQSATSEVLRVAREKLAPLFEAEQTDLSIKQRFNRQRSAWDLFYDALDAAEAGTTGSEEDKTVGARRAVPAFNAAHRSAASGPTTPDNPFERALNIVGSCKVDSSSV